VRTLWRATHPEAVERLDDTAAELRSIGELLAICMPKMIRQRIYDDPPLRIRDLIFPDG
jgi:hypothetical protein